MNWKLQPDTKGEKGGLSQMVRRPSAALDCWFVFLELLGFRQATLHAIAAALCCFWRMRDGRASAGASHTSLRNDNSAVSHHTKAAS